MNDILFEVLRCVVIITIMAITGYLMPWLKNNTELAKNEILNEIITAAVLYAEQTITGARSGAERKAIVTEYLKEQLRAKNISISDAQLDTLIEAAVFTMNREKSYGNGSTD